MDFTIKAIKENMKMLVILRLMRESSGSRSQLIMGTSEKSIPHFFTDLRVPPLLFLL